MTRAKVQKLTEEQGIRERRNHINDLPEELLLKVLQQLAMLPPEDSRDDVSPERVREREGERLALKFPFRRLDVVREPHPGLRSYPFLGQVCKHWKQVLDTPAARKAIWGEVVVDFGHELITAVHTPIAWSDKRPTDEEFKQSFNRTRLDSERIINFIAQRACSLDRVVLMSSEGYYSDEGDFVNLVSKHDFTMVSFGAMCGLLYNSLRQLTVLRCSDFFNVNSGAFGTIACLKQLQSLRIEDMHCRVDPESISKLSKLTQLTELVLTVQYASGNSWLIGLEKIPAAWSKLVSLKTLVLRGHGQLAQLPEFLADLPLEHLDLSLCHAVELSILPKIKSLTTLCLEDMNLVDSLTTDAAIPDDSQPRLLPDLSGLTNLTALNLAENRLSAFPAALEKLTRLQFLDLSGNENLQVHKPLRNLHGLTQLELVDLQGIHMECQIRYWSEAKCATMSHLANWRHFLRRKGAQVRLLLDEVDNKPPRMP